MIAGATFNSSLDRRGGCYAISALTGYEFGVIAIVLRGVASLMKAHGSVLTGAWLLSGDGLFILLMLAAGIGTLSTDAPDQADSVSFTAYVSLMVLLTLPVSTARPA